MKLIITRHPITRENKLGIVQGKNVGTFEEDGFEQIKKLIVRLKKEKIDRIISSDAQRCQVMTNEILKEINVPHEFTGLVDEKNYGKYVGKKGSEISQSALEGDTLETEKFLGGENLLDIRERAKKFLKYLEKYKDSNETILIVSHSIFLLIFIGLILGLNVVSSRYKLSLDHCSVSIIEINKDNKFKYNLKVLNETNFLS